MVKDKENIIRVLKSLLTFTLFSLVISGCSSSSITPISSGNANDLNNVPDFIDINSDHKLLGTWSISFDTRNLTAQIEPYRPVNMHYNVTSVIPPPRIVINDFNPATNVIDIDVTLENNSIYNVYDVRAIIYTDDIGHMLLNPDAWTGLYEMPGGEIINPFIAYAKDQPYRLFESMLQHTVNMLIYLPQGNTEVKFAMDASLPGNCEEPYSIDNFTHSVLYERTGGWAVAEVDVFDWQDDVSEVYLECEEITGQPRVYFSHQVSSKWKMDLVNSTGAGYGEYYGIITTLSQNSGFLALYQQVVITITPGINLNPQLIGQLHFLNNCEDVYVSGDYAYVSDGQFGFDIIDISSPAQPEVVYGSYLFGEAKTLVARDNYLFTAGRNQYVNIFDVTDPHEPEFVAVVDTIEDSADLEFYGDYLYVALYLSDEIFVVNIEDPENPVELGSFSCSEYCDGIKVSGDYLLALDLWDGFEIFDITIDPVSPLSMGYTEVNRIEDIEASGSFAFAACGPDGIIAYDISTPSNPQVISSIYTGGSYDSLVISGNYIYSGAFSPGLKIIDKTDPYNLVEIASFYTVGHAIKIHVVNDKAFIAGSDGFEIVDVSDPYNPISLGQIMDSGDASAVGVKGDYAYLTKRWTVYAPSEKIGIVDISDPVNPREVGSIPLTQWGNEITIQDSYAYVAAGYYHDEHMHEGPLYILDISDPGNPELIETKYGFLGLDIAVSDNYAVVADSAAGFDVYHLSPPGHAYFLCSCDFTGTSYGVAISGSNAYISGYYGLYIVDGSDPQLLGHFDQMESALDVQVSGNFAYVSEVDGNHVLVVDITNPSLPQLHSTIDVGGSSCLTIENNLLFAGINRNMKIYDISDTENIKRVEWVSFDYPIEDIEIEHNYAYLANERYGFSIVRLWEY